MPSPVDESLTVNTHRVEELTSTKLRALYDRRKGRDVHDLYRIAHLDLNEAAVRKMVLDYFYRANKVFHYLTFVCNVELKIAGRGFRDDVRALIRHGTELDWETACQEVLARFEFLGALDDRDQLFLDLAKFLLGKPYPKAMEALLHGIERPLVWLMEGLPISAEAQAVTQEDIKPFRPDADA